MARVELVGEDEDPRSRAVRAAASA